MAENGGALRLGAGAQVAVESVRFSENSGFQGGAISTSDGDARLSVQNSDFLRNRSVSYGGAIFAEGGIIDITRSSFQNNEADYYGGAIAAHAGRMSISNSTFAEQPGIRRRRSRSLRRRSNAHACDDDE